jgi:hypothetical protein
MRERLPSASAAPRLSSGLRTVRGRWRRAAGSVAPTWPVTAVGIVLLIAAAAATRVRHGAMVAAVMLLMAVMQFSSFARDYHGDYRIRVNSWLGGNLRAALETIIDRCANDACARVYFAHLQSTGGLADIRNYWMDAYWRFYLIKHNRETLLVAIGAQRSGPESRESLQAASCSAIRVTPLSGR